MNIEDIDKAQGAKKLLRQWDGVKRAAAANPPTRIVLQAQGGPAFTTAGNVVVLDSEPEFADFWVLLKAVVDRKHAEALTALATAIEKTEQEVADALGVARAV